MANTNLVNLVAIHATAETAPPTWPSAGASLSQATLNSAGYETIGSRNLGSHDYDLDEDTIEIALEKVFEPIEPPRAQAREESIPLKVRPEPFEFVCYDVSQGLWTLDSNLSLTSSGVATPTNTTTKRTVIIEITDTKAWYLPSCIVSIVGEPQGFASGGVARTNIQVIPHRTTSYPGGAAIKFYQ